MNTNKIKFQPNNSLFYNELKENVNNLLNPKIIYSANKLMKFKLIIYGFVFVMGYLSLYFLTPHASILFLIFNYIIIGLTGILLAFNVSHDAVHETLFKDKRLNKLIYYLSFNLQGVNAKLWRKRHISSHHLFANVDGCDADIDNNPFIRLSPTQPLKSYHHFQHIYALIIYCLYTVYWILIKDIQYLFKKDLANIKNQTYSFRFILEFIGLKLLYFAYMLIFPILFTQFAFYKIIIAFLIMHCCISLFFVLTLIISHLCVETQFPIPNKDGVLPYNFYEHQLAVSLDYSPTSKIANFILGGFNSHAAHHLFPKLPHTTYTIITPLIQAAAIKHNLPYHQLSIPKAIVSHFKYLKQLGKK